MAEHRVVATPPRWLGFDVAYECPNASALDRDIIGPMAWVRELPADATCRVCGEVFRVEETPVKVDL